MNIFSSCTVNEGLLDRYIRVFLGSVLVSLGCFWAPRIVDIIALIAGLALVITGLIGYCGAYSLFHFTTIKNTTGQLSWKKFLGLVLITIFLLSSMLYGSFFFSKKMFIEDFARLNTVYKQTLFQTGQNNLEVSKQLSTELEEAFEGFKVRYSYYQPLPLKLDTQFGKDLEKIQFIINDSKTRILHAEDLPTIHKELEEVRTLFQDILKRNHFSLLTIALVDFHDSMEKVLDAVTEKNTDHIFAAYSEANEKLKTVEMDINTSEIHEIRTHLEKIVELAKNNNIEAISAEGQALKSSFVKVYLQNN